MKKSVLRFVLVALLSCVHLVGFAGVGMWLPFLIGRNLAEMESMGCKLSESDIYDVNNSSLKDAVVIFGSGCTSEFISADGLLLTNYHCGYESIANNSSVDNNMLLHGYAAKDKNEELPCSGLKVRHLLRMEDVTDRVTAYLESARKEQMAEIEEGASLGGVFEAHVDAIFGGNQFILSVYEVLDDVRLVAAPPSELGKFGGDTDNWMWPRQTCDFSLFRVYKNNEPYHPEKFLKINAQGVKEGDFAMVYGYPGTTNMFKTSHNINYNRNVSWPRYIDYRQKRANVLDSLMSQNEELSIEYASDYSSVTNVLKKQKGQTECIDMLDVINKKRREEADLLLASNENGVSPLYGVLQELDAMYSDSVLVCNFMTSGMLMAIIRDLNAYRAYVCYAKSSTSLISGWLSKPYYLECSNRLDKVGIETFLSFLPEWRKEMAKDPDDSLFPIYEYLSYKPEQLIDSIYSSKLFDKEYAKACDEGLETMSYKQTFAYHFIMNLMKARARLDGELKTPHLRQRRLEAKYIQILEGAAPDSLLFPDANFTLRVSYGKVEPARTGKPDVDVVFTTAKQLVAKSKSAVADYAISDSIATVLSGDYGRYADPDGDLHTCFVASVHTTGGNSGSPTLNANGELLGANFDRSWYGIASDYYFDDDRSRNISVDIRYVLFVLDKVCGVPYLIDEMDVVW